MPIEAFAPITTVSEVTVSLEPVFNILTSMFATMKSDYTSGFSNWVDQTMEAMTPQEQDTNRLVTVGLYFALLPDRSWASFPAYLHQLESEHPTVLRERILQAYAKICMKGQEPATQATGAVAPDWETILASEETYMEFLLDHFGHDKIDQDVERRAYHYVIDPPAMQALIVSHLRHMWEKYLSPEWERVRPMLQDCVRAFAQIELDRMERLEAIERVIGREVQGEKWEHILKDNKRLVFVPNAHTGPYPWHFEIGEANYISFGARLPKGALFEAPDLSRTEILVRLSTLADDTRLSILRFVTEHGEQRSQEIMSALDLSQSAVSRHLTQLSAAGYLDERRCEGAKCYSINPERIEETLQAVAAYLLVEVVPRYSA